VTKKKLVRRTAIDRSQRIRLGVQLGFLALNVWMATQFYIWVRFYETGGRSLELARPDGIEGWLPIAALMNLKYWIVTGDVPRVHAAGMFLLIAFLATSLLARKAFCGWLCPIGTISEYLWKFGRQTFRRTWALPKWLDIPLRSLKYILLGLFAYAVLGMSAEAIDAFLQGPYGQVADVKMLNFFRYLSTGAAITIAFLVLASVFVQNFWCRYFCPYGAMMGLVALLSPMRIRRTPEKCIDCAKCAKACPSLLPVESTGSDPVGGMPGLHGVRGRLPGLGGAFTECPGPQAGCSCMGDCRDRARVVRRRLHIRELYGVLADEIASTRVLRTGAEGERIFTPVVPNSLKLCWYSADE
jgi:polyferredoxin